jgi:hypothetical protein
MIQVSENYRIDSDKYQFILERFYDGKERATGAVKRQSKLSYHATLEQVARKMLGESAKEAESITEAVQIMNKLAAEIAVNLEQHIKRG